MNQGKAAPETTDPAVGVQEPDYSFEDFWLVCTSGLDKWKSFRLGTLQREVEQLAHSSMKLRRHWLRIIRHLTGVKYFFRCREI